MEKQFASKSELFKHLKENKAALIAEKKYKTKEADSIYYSAPVSDDEGVEIKTIGENKAEDFSKINVTSVVNTIGILDSHGDVHIKGIWKKSLSEQKSLYLLQEHQMKFDKIITDKVIASTKNISWSDLGFEKYKGTTEALVFESTIDASRNPFMFEQYVKGYVKNHSVGMRYVTMHLCIDSEEKYYREEKENFDKYITQVINQDEAKEQGYFWAVTEAKIIEGSAVPIGSNVATPTLSITESKEAATSTSSIEPSKDTQRKENLLKFLN